ncbi:ribosomal protection-like ABC-F family protein [Risungbinella massiliensis]|uniref:ribosomal protection-like ABC-F family protein n=1 Tax=Risungbinella massiliensis TaxID=1329796 RepID=UPI0005CC4715|nr:ABC-F family ATP-binding cassette domain-containing protein [Risungbinella massiliensis]
MIICSMQRVTQTYGANTIFRNLACEIKQGERIGLIGRNGEGKTTLLKLMAGHIQPSEGLVIWMKGGSAGLLQQSPIVEDQKTVKEILFDVFRSLFEIKEQMAQMEQALSQELEASKLEMYLEKYGSLQDQFEQNGGYEMDSQINRIVHGLQITQLMEKQWCQLSGGERTKVGLTQLLLKKPDLLLLDEPTNHLDLPAIEWLTDFIRKYNGTVVVVSHDRYFLDDVVTSILELELGELITYHGNYSHYVREREERLLQQFQQYQDQQKKMKKMKEAIKRLKDWANRSNPPSDGLHRRAKSMEKALMRIEVLKKPVLKQKKIDLDFQMNKRSGKDVALLEDVCKKVGSKELFRNVNMFVRFQEHVAIVGANGSGKTTLLNIIAGLETVDGGGVKLGSNLSIGYLSQHVIEINQQFTVIDEFREKISVSEEEARNILAKFLFYGNAVFRKVQSLSGGERMRLRLAQLMHQHYNLLILDEPTNHLDIESKEVLEEALSHYQGTIIAVSHDRYFLDRLFQRIYWISHDQLTRYEGNYTFSRKKRRELDRLDE